MIKLILVLALAVTSTFANAQLKGSRKTVTQTYDYQNFTKVDFNNLAGKLEIEVGKPFSITISVDDNLVNILTLIEHAENN